MGHRRVRVAIVDDHEVVREGLVSLLAREPDLEVVATCASAEELLERLPAVRPDVVTIDYRLPGITGSAGCRQVLARMPSCSVLILTSYTDDGIIQACLEAGARGYVTKDMDQSDLPTAIRAVGRGEAVLAPAVTARVIEWSRRAREADGRDFLEPREVEILGLVAEGMANKKIAAKLFVSEATVKAAMGDILRKLGVSRRWEAVAAGIQRGLI